MDQHKRSTLKRLFSGTAVATAYAAFPATIGKGFMTLSDSNTEAEITGFENRDKSFKAVENYAKMYDITAENALALLKEVQADQDALILAAASGFIGAVTHNAFNNGVPLCDENLSKIAAPSISGLNASFASDALIAARAHFKDFPLTKTQTLIDNYGMSAEKAEKFTADHKHLLSQITTLSGFGAAFLKESQTKRGVDHKAEPQKPETEIATLKA